MGRYLHRFIFPFAILLFVANILYVWQSPAMSSVAINHDEYIFYRLTMNLPRMYTDAKWLDENELTKPTSWTRYSDDYIKRLNEAAYTTPIWIHPVIVNYVAYPIARLFTDPALEIKKLRLMCVSMIIITVVLFLDIIRRRTNRYIAVISVFPMLVGQWLLANGIMFYNDVFMWLFFALTIWVIECKPQSRWIIPLTLITVLSKMSSFLLLIPIWLLINHKTKRIDAKVKVVLPSIVAILGFFIFQAMVAKDALYLVHHWSGTLTEFAKNFITQDVFPHIEAYILCWGLYVSLPLIIIGTVVAIKKRLVSYYPFVALSIIVMLYGFQWGWFAYQVYPVMYASMFMMPVVLPLIVNVEENERLRYQLV